MTVLNIYLTGQEENTKIDKNEINPKDYNFYKFINGEYQQFDGKNLDKKIKEHDKFFLYQEIM